MTVNRTRREPLKWVTLGTKISGDELKSTDANCPVSSLVFCSQGRKYDGFRGLRRALTGVPGDRRRPNTSLLSRVKEG